MPDRPTANRWKRYDIWDERPLRLDGFAPDSPEDGFRATKSGELPRAEDSRDCNR